MTDTAAKTPATPALLSAIRRIAADNGLTVSEAGFEVPPEVYGSVFELEDGSKVFVERGQQAPEAFKAVTSVWSAASVRIDSCAETSPEVLEIAGRGLAHPESLSLDEVKSVCASALVQAPAAAA